MTFSRRLVKGLLLAVACVSVLSCASLATASTIPVRTGSGYGPSTNLGFASCANLSNNQACEQFDLTPIGTVSVDGILSFNVVQFASNSNSTENPVLDVFNLGSIAPGQTFTLTSALFSPADLANAQIFSCGVDPQGVNTNPFTPIDSNGQAVNGPCTPGLFNATSYALLVSNGVVNGSASFTTTADFNLTDLVLEVPAAPVATPEPASLALLGTGLVVFLGQRARRRKRA